MTITSSWLPRPESSTSSHEAARSGLILEGQGQADYTLNPTPRGPTNGVQFTSTFSSTRPNCAGASSATTRNSKANSASPISKGEAGAASIITQPCASPLMDSLSANERRFPPQVPRAAKHLAYPPVPDPETPPIRPERHIENSIATIRRQLTVALARTLLRCPCCQAFPARPPMRPPYRGSS